MGVSMACGRQGQGEGKGAGVRDRRLPSSPCFFNTLLMPFCFLSRWRRLLRISVRYTHAHEFFFISLAVACHYRQAFFLSLLMILCFLSRWFSLPANICSIYSFTIDHTELPAKQPDCFLRRNKSNINQNEFLLILFDLFSQKYIERLIFIYLTLSLADTHGSYCHRHTRKEWPITHTNIYIQRYRQKNPGFRGPEERGYWGEEDLIPMMPDQHDWYHNLSAPDSKHKTETDLTFWYIFRISFIQNHFNRNKNKNRVVPVTFEFVTISDICEQSVTKSVLLKNQKKIRACDRGHKFESVTFCDHRKCYTLQNLSLFLFGIRIRIAISF